MTILSWDLVSPIEYTALEELSFNLHFEAPENTEEKKFYILGGLYTDTTYIPGTLFGILKAAGVDYGVNDPAYVTLWELEPEEEVDLPCKFIIGRSNCLLALFLMRMVGDEPNVDDDEQLALIQAELTAPVPIGEDMASIVTQYVMPIALIGVTFGVLAYLTKPLSK